VLGEQSVVLATMSAELVFARGGEMEVKLVDAAQHFEYVAEPEE